jgi:IS4 transposase
MRFPRSVRFCQEQSEASEDIALARAIIEVFFKFIKQNLQCKHFISYQMNRMKAYLYCLLIAAILFTIFKIGNQLKGFKSTLLQFSLAMEKAMIKDIVTFCGGNPDLVELRL